MAQPQPRWRHADPIGDLFSEWSYPLFDNYRLTIRLPTDTANAQEVRQRAYTALDCVQRPVLAAYEKFYTFLGANLGIGVVVESDGQRGSIFNLANKPTPDPDGIHYRLQLADSPVAGDSDASHALATALDNFVMRGLRNRDSQFAARFAQNLKQFWIPYYADQVKAWQSAWVGTDQGKLYLSGLPAPPDPCIAMPSKYAWGAPVPSIDGTTVKHIQLGSGASLTARRLYINDGSAFPALSTILTCANVDPYHDYKNGDLSWNDAQHATGFHPFARVWGSDDARFWVPETYGDASEMGIQDDLDMLYLDDGFYTPTTVGMLVDDGPEIEQALTAALRKPWGLKMVAKPGYTPMDTLPVVKIVPDNNIVANNPGRVYVGPFKASFELPECLKGKTWPRQFGENWLDYPGWKYNKVLSRNADNTRNVEVFVPGGPFAALPDGVKTKEDAQWLLYNNATTGEKRLCVTNIRMPGLNGALLTGEVHGVADVNVATDDRGACQGAGKRLFMRQYTSSSNDYGGALAACRADTTRAGPCIRVQNQDPFEQGNKDWVVAPIATNDSDCKAPPPSDVPPWALPAGLLAIILAAILIWRIRRR